MMTFKFSKRSLNNLAGVHKDLQTVIREALSQTDIDFVVLEGLRDAERQKKLKAAGASTTLRSRHLTGHAVDVGAWVAGTIRWNYELYEQLAKTVKQAAKDCDVPIEWGGDWKSFKDGGHFQLPRKYYP